MAEVEGGAIHAVSLPEFWISFLRQVYTYIGFRVGGLGYGPRFRCLQPTHGLMVEARGFEEL